MKINAYNDRRSKFKTTIAIAFQIYLNWCWQFREASEELWIFNTICNYDVFINEYRKELKTKTIHVTSNYKSMKCFYERAWWFVFFVAFKNYRMNITDDIMWRLSMMYYEK